MTDEPEKQSILPSFLKTASRDAVARYAAAGIGSAAVAWAAGWASARGFYVPSKDTLALASQGIGGLILFFLMMRWGSNAAVKSEKVVVANTMEAAATGLVPAAIAAKATPEQIAKVEASPQATIAPVPPVPPAAGP